MLKVSVCNLSLCRHLHFFDLSRWRCWFCCLWKRRCQACWVDTCWHMLFLSFNPPKYCVAHWLSTPWKKYQSIVIMSPCREEVLINWKHRLVEHWKMQTHWHYHVCWGKGLTARLPVTVHIETRSGHMFSKVTLRVLGGIPHAQRSDQNGCETNGWILLLYHSVHKKHTVLVEMKPCSWDPPCQRVLPGCWTTMNRSTKTLTKEHKTLAKPPRKNMGQLLTAGPKPR